MKKLIMLAAAVGVIFGSVARGQDIAGDWQGTLKVGKGLRLIMHIYKGSKDGFNATLYSIDQQSAPTATVVSVKGPAIKTLVSSVRSLIFRGILGPAKEGAEGIPSDIRPILRAELREFLLLNNSEHSPHSAEDKEQRSSFVSK